MNLDKSLETLENSVIEMGELVVKQHEICAELLKSRDKESALRVIEKDQFVNKAEEDINNQVIAGFALLSPVASDLRCELVAVKIASELERIGDYAKGLASFIIKHDEEGYDDLLEYAIIMEREIVVMLKAAIEAYKERKLELAFEIPGQDSAIDTLMKEFRNKLEGRNDIDLKYVFYLSGLFRNVERSGDHIVNICEHIVYLIKGIHYDFD